MQSIAVLATAYLGYIEPPHMCAAAQHRPKIRSALAAGPGTLASGSGGVFNQRRGAPSPWQAKLEAFIKDDFCGVHARGSSFLSIALIIAHGWDVLFSAPHNQDHLCAAATHKRKIEAQSDLSSRHLVPVDAVGPAVSSKADHSDPQKLQLCSVYPSKSVTCDCISMKGDTWLPRWKAKVPYLWVH
eukprot:2419155-Amphidinium_carterae.1